MSATLEAIVEDLRSLPQEDLEAAASYIHRLKDGGWRKQRMEWLQATAGSLAGPDGDEFEAAIAECERIDENAW